MGQIVWTEKQYVFWKGLETCLLQNVILLHINKIMFFSLAKNVIGG